VGGAAPEGCRERTYLKVRGAARTDSTHVLGSLPILRGWERTAQTMRAALNALAAAETQPGSQSTPIRSALSVTAGVSRTSGCPRARRPGHNTSKDGSRRRWHAPSRATRCSLHAPSPQRELAEVELLRQIWEQYYEISDGQIRVLDPKEMPEAAQRIPLRGGGPLRYQAFDELGWLQGAPYGELRRGTSSSDHGRPHNCSHRHRRKTAYAHPAEACGERGAARLPTGGLLLRMWQQPRF
jgi:transposase